MVAQTVEIAGKRLVILEEADYLKLRSLHGDLSGDFEFPPLPPRNRAGRRPAAAYILSSIARDIVEDRKAAGLTQVELARQAGIRQETLSRLEAGKHTPTMKTLQKIDRALARTAPRVR